MKNISRAQGRSSVAAAAYRSCSKLVDHRTGLKHDFTRKGNDLVHSEILMPANAPKQFLERSNLWNTIEKSEKRKDARLCADFVISLQTELNEEQNWEMAKTFVQKEFVSLDFLKEHLLNQIMFFLILSQ